jgi:hypothetical protein
MPRHEASRTADLSVTSARARLGISSPIRSAPIVRLFGIPYAIPSTARSYQALTFYPALAYGLNNDRINGANFRIIGVGNRGLSGIVYSTKVASGRSKQNRYNARGGRFGKIADPKFHARKIKRKAPISNGKSSAYA